MIHLQLTPDTKITVGWFHEPPERLEGNASFKGLTSCWLEVWQAGELVQKLWADAFCHPEDKWDRAVGRRVSLDRLLLASHFSRAERTAIWAAYHSRKQQSLKDAFFAALEKQRG